MECYCWRFIIDNLYNDLDNVIDGTTTVSKASTATYANNFSITTFIPTANASYVTVDSATNKAYRIGNLIIVNVNIKIIASVPTSGILLQNLPVCKYTAGAAINTTNNQAKVRISTDISNGTAIYSDGANSVTGWYSGQLIYLAA